MFDQDNKEKITNTISENNSYNLKGRCYDVYRKSDGTWETIKIGFSWPAMLFGAIWAWVSGMVGIGFALLALGIFLRILPALLAGINPYSSDKSSVFILSLLVSIVLPICVGLFGNEWRKNSMSKRGYELIAKSVHASNKEEAIRNVSSNGNTLNTD
jgi:hypothetical protein